MHVEIKEQLHGVHSLSFHVDLSGPNSGLQASVAGVFVNYGAILLAQICCIFKNQTQITTS